MKKVNDEELKNVSGSTGGGSDAIVCPSCKYCSTEATALVSLKEDGCSTTRHYKCPFCHHEWDD